MRQNGQKLVRRVTKVKGPVRGLDRLLFEADTTQNG
jgi:hypothetical protein